VVPVFVDTDLFSAKRKPESADRKLIGLIGPFDAASARQRGSLEFLVREIRNFDSRIDFAVIGRCDERIDDKRITYTGYLDSIKDYISRLHELDGVLIAEGAMTYGPLNKIIEPMACSLPVFATPKGAVALYWVEPGRDIFVFDENELVDKINQLVFNDRLMQNIGENARKVVNQYYSKKANEEKLFGIMESLRK
jgi:glycosyltransferase involved in cell wall biosynthesis